MLELLRIEIGIRVNLYAFSWLEYGLADFSREQFKERSTRRALAFNHGDLYDKDGFMKQEEVCEPKRPLPSSFN